MPSRRWREMRRWKCRVLLSPSLLARRLDFDPSVSHVGAPSECGDFMHCVWRTERAGGSGQMAVLGMIGGRASGVGKVRKMRQRIFASQTQTPYSTPLSVSSYLESRSR